MYVGRSTPQLRTLLLLAKSKMAAAAILSFGKRPYVLNDVRYQIEILHVYYSGHS